MNRSRTLLAASILFAAGCAAHPRPEAELFFAPEGSKKHFDSTWGPVDRVYAEVLTWRGESAIALVAESANHPGWPMQISKWAYFSADANQGQVVIGVAWSPDGRFLAYQITSSGGHQPYHASIIVLDLATGDETVLQDLLGRNGHEYVPEICWVTADVSPERRGPAISWTPGCLLRFFAVCDSLNEFREYVYDPVAQNLQGSPSIAPRSSSMSPGPHVGPNETHGDQPKA